MDDTETTFPQLHERIEKTVAFLKKADAKKFDGKEKAEVSVDMGPERKFKFTGKCCWLLVSRE